MDASDPLCPGLKNARPELPLREHHTHPDRCLDIPLGQVRFLLSLQREWCDGLLVHAHLGQPTEDGPLMREAMRLNRGNATRHEPIYALQDGGLVCRYRLRHTDAHAPALIERLQRVAEQQQAWVEAGWLRVLEEEACA